MRRAMTLVGLLLVGCSTPGPQLKTPVPETISIPPEDDPRYSRPIEYPKEVLNRPPVKPASPGGPGAGAGSPSSRMGPSMGY